MQKKSCGGSGWACKKNCENAKKNPRGGVPVGGQGGCIPRIEVIVKIGGQGGCVRRIEVIVKMKKKSGGLGGGSGWLCTKN